MQSLIVFAPNVGGGGGLVLLRELLRAEWPGMKLTAILDRRGQSGISDVVQDWDVHWVDSSIGGRWRAETLLAQLAEPDEAVLCFHNLPPVVARGGRIFCFVQNANLVGLIPTSHLSGWLRLRYTVERFIARRFRRRVERYMVQTPTMAAALADWYGAGVPPIDILPFVAGEHLKPAAQPSATGERRWDFIYVSDGSFHKNHRRLFEAWQMLAVQNVFPTLAVTLHPERDAVLRAELKEFVDRFGLRIEDLGQIPHAEVLDNYRRSGALIFPSYAESFGIPLVEAMAAGLPIVASETDYVRDLCDPATTFDPFSPRSIARAVRRFLRLPSDHVRLISADAFGAALRERAEAGKS